MIEIGGSETDDDQSTQSPPTTPMATPERQSTQTEREGSLKKRPIAIGSSSSSNSSSESSSESSSSSSSSSESSESQDTQELMDKISTSNQMQINHTPTKHLANTDQPEGPSQDTERQSLGPRSGSGEAHITPHNPHGKAGDLNEAAGPCV